jgi:L-talarate/galactarate dehydratase
MPITTLESHHFRLPQASQRISLTDARRNEALDLLTVTLHTEAGLTGVGFTYAMAGAAAMRSLIENEFATIVVGAEPSAVDELLGQARSLLRATGWHGLTARAWAAIDIALWDLKAKTAGVPLYRLLGGARAAASMYLSGVAGLGQDIGESLKIARPLIEDGALGLYVEVGGGNVQLDADRVQQIRDGLGEDSWLGIAVEGRYDLGTALALAHFYEEDVGIDRYEFPLPAADVKGYQRLSERMEVSLALGSGFDRREDFRQLLERGDVRVLRPDPLRLGGITPLLKVAALAEAYPVVVTPYRLPEIGVHLACGLSNVDAVEYTSVLAGAFVKPLRAQQGKLVPPDLPGHGLELNFEALRRYAVG